MKYIQNFICAVIILNCVKSLLSNLTPDDNKITGMEFNDNLVRRKRITRTTNYKFEYNFQHNPPIYLTSTNINEKYILKAMSEITSHSCITFSHSYVFKDQQTKLEIILVSDNYTVPERIFFAYIPFYLTESCNRNYDCVFWEFFYYLTNSLEQNRSDRDKYIKVNKNNIDKSKKGCSKKYKRDEFQLTFVDLTSFDYGSFTLAKRNECSINGKNTIKARKSLYNNMIGQRYHPSFNDWKLLNELWCKNRCNQPIVCDYESYPDYNKCNRHCVCPNGFEGKSCSSIVQSDEKCGKQHLTPTRKRKYLKIHGNKKCTYLIKANKFQKVKLVIFSLSSPKVEPCFEKKGLQIKYTEDLGSTGLCLCGRYKQIKLFSSSQEVLLQYYGNDNHHHLKLFYQLK